MPPRASPISPRTCRKKAIRDLKNLGVKLLGVQMLCLLITLLTMWAFFARATEQSQQCAFLAAGQTATAAVASGCAQKGGAQAALDDSLQQPGVAWACVVAPGGPILAHTAGANVSPPLLRWLGSTTAPFVQTGTLTVFRRPILSRHIGAVYAALDRDAFDRARARHFRAALAVVTALLLLLFAATHLALWRFTAPVKMLTETARRMEREPQAEIAFAPVVNNPLFASLASAFGAALIALRKHLAKAGEEDARCRLVLETAGHGLWQSTPQGKYLCLNQAMAMIYGYATVDELRQHLEAMSTYVSPNRRAEFLRLMREQGSVTDFESQIRRGDGTTAWISESVRIVPSFAGGGDFWTGTVEDITLRRRTESDRAHLGNYLRLLLESSGEGIYGVDAQGNCTFINIAGAHLLGYQPAEVLGKSMHALVHHSHADHTLYPEERSYLYQSIQTGQRFRVDEDVLWRKDGVSFAAEYTTAPLIEGGRTAGAVVTFVDITARKAMETEQKRLLTEALERADHDPLTGLLNHRAFHKRLHEEADRAQRAGTSLAVVLLDIDNFKFFNDVYGHKVGDEVLGLVAETLRAGSRSYDVTARFGGDEFALLMPCQGDETTASLTAHLNQRLAGVSYQLPGHDVRIPLGLSVGVALFPTDGPTRAEAVEIADERLRRAKTGGDEDGYADRVRSALLRDNEGFSMLDALVTAVDNKDRYTRRHSEDVMRYSVQIAQQMGLGEETQRLVEIAALVHDVGKIGVPDSILRKPGQLNDEEFDAVKQHPIMGAVIAEAIPGFDGTLDAIRHHHERWDGQGYPAGLAGEDIPFLARLMAVADSYSAMTTDRPYRKGMDKAKALGILAGGAGVQWDSQCVAAFQRAQNPVPIATAV